MEKLLDINPILLALIAALLLVVACAFAACKISSEISREEEMIQLKEEYEKRK